MLQRLTCPASLCPGLFQVHLSCSESSLWLALSSATHWALVLRGASFSYIFFQYSSGSAPGLISTSYSNKDNNTFCNIQCLRYSQFVLLFRQLSLPHIFLYFPQLSEALLRQYWKHAWGYCLGKRPISDQALTSWFQYFSITFFSWCPLFPLTCNLSIYSKT